MRILIGLSVLASLILIAIVAKISGVKPAGHKRALNASQTIQVQRDTTVSLKSILQAHNVLSPAAVSAYTIQGVRLTHYNDESGRTPGFFERRLTISTDGHAFKFTKTDTAGIRQINQYSDGNSMRRITTAAGQTEEIEESETALDTAKFQVATVALVQILRRLSEPQSEIHYVESLPEREKFDVVSAKGSWSLYVDHEHLIRRLDIGDVTIDYADYRPVNGIKLPFFERRSRGTTLNFELVFERIELNPKFPPGFFAFNGPQGLS